MAITISSALDYCGMRELGADAVFTISSAKPGNGVDQIRDERLDTYWQSDGAAPHYINIHFMEKKEISHICIFCDFNGDESYTIKKVCVRSGTTAHDLIDVTTFELTEPIGWVSVPLKDPLGSESHLRTHLLQVKIISMHQNGMSMNRKYILISS